MENCHCYFIHRRLSLPANHRMGKPIAEHCVSQQERLNEMKDWISPLGISVVLFLVVGALYIFTGGATALLLNKFDLNDLIVSNRTDSIVFGKAPAELLRDDPALFQLRTILLFIVGGLLFVAGCFQIALTWFGLRQGQMWALATLTIGDVAILPFWILALRPYFQQNVNLTLADLPPFMWIPAALLLPAVVLGWIGLR